MAIPRRVSVGVVPKRDLLQRSQRVAGFEWPLFHRCKRIQLTS